MSTTTLRYSDLTVSFVPFRRERELGRTVRHLRVRVSRRRFRQAARDMLNRFREMGA